MMSAMTKKPVIHLVSDASGSTLQGLVRACMAQFEDLDPEEKFWPLIRTEKQLDRVINAVERDPGPVFFTLVNDQMRRLLKKRCAALGLPCMPVLDPLIKGVSSYFGVIPKGIPGLQHILDDAYFDRVDAVDFALSFDDGQNLTGLEDADVILTGVSRTSKTPTCIFLARRGIKAANIPYVPGVPFPQKVVDLSSSILVVGLTEHVDRLVALRKTRLRADDRNPHYQDNMYLDYDRVKDEVLEARRFFTKHSWPIVDVTKRSVEETAAEIQVMINRRDSKSKANESLKLFYTLLCRKRSVSLSCKAQSKVIR
jgi:hypothetical protein